MRPFACLLLLAGAVLAEDAFYVLSVRDLEYPEGALPASVRADEWIRAVLDGPGEAFLHLDRSPLSEIAIRAPKDAGVTGTLLLPKDERAGMQRLRFRLPPGAPQDEPRFRALRAQHYRALLRRNIAGASWFRHRLIETGIGADPAQERRWGRDAESELEGTFSFFTGGRAISENLQLERAVPGSEAGEPEVALDTLKGISVAEMDWTPHLEGVVITADPLARHIPADQHALFFPSFNAMVALMDAADREGTPILHSVEPRTEDARTRERYERQLCLRTDALARALGPAVIASVAFTGSDPYLRTGTDVTILFEAPDADMLATLLTARRKAAAADAVGVREVTGDIAGRAWHGLVTPTRTVSSYMLKLDGVVVLSNSLGQLERVVNERSGLAALPEYAFFRHRYARGDGEETALLVIPDAAIRRWCGPRWRIAASRRVRAAAVLAELQASHLDGLLAGRADAGVLDAPWSLVDPGRLALTEAGITSSIYNTLDFLTPVSELAFTHVTEQEADLYRRWRDGYQRNWSRYFDPIAARFTVAEDRVAVDVTVMPLILGTDYAQWVGIVRGARIGADAGDRHAGPLLHFALAVDTDATLVRQASGFLQVMAGQVGLHPLGWLGASVAVYLEDDAVFREAMAAEDPENHLEDNLHRLPVAVVAEVKSPMKLAAFLAALRAFIQQSAPGMTIWENVEHGELQFVKVSPAPNAKEFDRFTVCYATLPDALVVTLSEDLLRAVLDRRAQGEFDRGRPWLGGHLCLRARRDLLEIVEGIFGGNWRDELRQRSWNSLFVLNELRAAFPGREPVEVYERLSGVRLTCPGGGSYVWNEAWKTMESTAFGHPGEPREGPEDIMPFRGWRLGNFGLTFEEEGLRAACELLR